MVEKYEVTELSEDRLTPFLNLFIPGFYSKGTFVVDFAEPNMTKIDQWAQSINEDMNADGGYLSKGENLPAIFNTALKISTAIEKLVGKKISGIIQEAGTKKQGEYYLDRDNFGIFYCKTESTTIINDPAIFENYSNFEIREKLKETIKELDKIASPTQLGRIKLGKGMTLKEGGVVDVENVDISGKLDKGDVSEDYNTGKKIEDKLSQIEEKFKNFCPYSIGDIYITTLSTNPAVRFLGTTWEKIEGKFLLSTSGSGGSGQTGGSNTKTITQANLPNIKLQVDSFSLSSTNTYISSMRGILGGSSSRGPVTVIAPGESPQLRTGASNGSDEGIRITQSDKSLNTGTASPYTSALGSGTPLDITPAYYTVHVWKRLT